MSTPAPTALLSIDFDGTLVDSHRPDPILKELAAALESLQSQGVKWAVNTGRTVNHSMEGFVHHQLPLLPDFLIAREREVYLRNHFNRWIHLGDWNRSCEKAHVKLFRKSKKTIKAVREFVTNSTTAQFIESTEEPCGIIATHLEEMDTICCFIESIKPADGDLHYERNSVYLRFSHRHFTKGSSLRFLSQSLGVPFSSVFAVGDSFNDITKLRRDIADMIACPSNAVTEVKAQVSESGGYIASTPAGEGVLEALYHFAARGQLPLIKPGNQITYHPSSGLAEPSF